MSVSRFCSAKLLKNCVINRNFSDIKKSLPNTNYCVEEVRKFDKENYLCSLLLPIPAKQSFFAIRAFNVEVSQAQDVTSNRHIARLRLQFWLDCIDEIYQGKVRETPIAQELRLAVTRHNLNKKWFMDIITARVENIEDQSFMNLQEVADYSDKVNASLNFLMLQCLDVQDLKVDHLACHLGKCQGLLTLLRGVPHHAQRHRVLLPTDLMIKHGVSQQEIIRGSREQKVKDLIFEIASEAHAEMETVKESQALIPKEAFVAFLPAVCCGAFLKSLQKVNFDIFDSRLQLQNGWLPLQLWWTNRKRSLR